MKTPKLKFTTLACIIISYTILNLTPAFALSCTIEELRSPGMQSPYYARFGITSPSLIGTAANLAIVAPLPQQNIFPVLTIQLGYGLDLAPNPSLRGNISNVQREIPIHYNQSNGRYEVDITGDLLSLPLVNPANANEPLLAQTLEITQFFGSTFYTPFTRVLAVRCR